MKYIINESWDELLKDYLKSKDFVQLGGFIQGRKRTFNVNVYPNNEDIFKAFRMLNIEDIKAVIIGLEPNAQWQSNGLAFGSNGDGHIPKDTCMMYKEYENTVMDGLDLMFDYSMEEISKKGVLMLNLALTIDTKQSHLKEWRNFMVCILRELNGETPIFIIGENALNCKHKLPQNPITNYKQILNSGVFNDIEAQTNIKFK